MQKLKSNRKQPAKEEEMLPESVRQSTKKFLANVVVNFTGVLIGILGFVGIGWVAAGLATVSLGVVLGTQYYLTYRPPVQKRDQQLSTFFDDYLGKAGEEIESVAGDDIEVRCNVMRPTAGGVVGDDRLEISFTADRDEYRPDELELEFKPGQGCAGAVYRQGKQQIAVRERRGEWPDGFETTPRQDNANRPPPGDNRHPGVPTERRPCGGEPGSSLRDRLRVRGDRRARHPRGASDERDRDQEHTSLQPGDRVQRESWDTLMTKGERCRGMSRNDAKEREASDQSGFAIYTADRTDEERRETYGTDLKDPVNGRIKSVAGRLRSLFR